MELIPTLYITGTGRSGTNVLKDMFSKHSQVATLPFEHRFTVDPDGLLPFYKKFSSWSPYIADTEIRRLSDLLYSLASRNSRIDNISKWMKNHPVFHNLTTFPYSAWEMEKWIPGYKRLVDKLITDITTYTYPATYPAAPSLQVDYKMAYCGPADRIKVANAIQEFMNSCYISTCKAQGKSCFVEDNTWTMLFADALLEVMPWAKVLVVIRDPRDVMASMLKQRWTPNQLDQLCTYYKDLMNSWLSLKKTLPVSAFKEIRLEDLVADPEQNLSDLCSWIDMDLDTKMLQHDLSKANSQRYKVDFNPTEIEMLNRELTTYLEYFNYTEH